MRRHNPGIKLPEGFVPPAKRAPPVAEDIHIPEMPHQPPHHPYADVRAAALNGSGAPHVAPWAATVASHRAAEPLSPTMSADHHAAKFGPYAAHVPPMPGNQPFANDQPHGQSSMNGNTHLHAGSGPPAEVAAANGYANGYANPHVNKGATVHLHRPMPRAQEPDRHQYANNNTAPSAPRRPAGSTCRDPASPAASILPMPGIQQTSTLIPDRRPERATIVTPRPRPPRSRSRA